jgi:hypothetical protein
MIIIRALKTKQGNVRRKEEMTPFKLDSGKFPHMNYNRVVQKSRRQACRNRPDTPMSMGEAKMMWKIAQDVNSVNEPQLAIKKRADNDRTRRGLI